MDEIDCEYCARCGARTIKPSSKYRHCDACQTDYYINPRPCNAIIITDASGRALLTKRAFDPAKGKWDLPGGFMDCEETAEESVRREAREELGVELDDIAYMNSGYDRYVFKGMNYHTLGFVFTAKIRGAQVPQPNDDVSEIRYFSREEIDMDALAFPVLRTTLEYFWDKKG
ncbi:MAG: NUDIX domain-containing protein [bacterium]